MVRLPYLNQRRVPENDADTNITVAGLNLPKAHWFDKEHVLDFHFSLKDASRPVCTLYIYDVNIVYLVKIESDQQVGPRPIVRLQIYSLCPN